MPWRGLICANFFFALGWADSAPSPPCRTFMTDWDDMPLKAMHLPKQMYILAVLCMDFSHRLKSDKLR